MAQQRLPIVNQDDGTWGDIIRQFLKKEHFDDGTDNASNGGHQNVSIRAGTTSAAPLTFAGTSGGTAAALLTTPVSGAMEYDASFFYLTQNGTRKKIAIYDDSSGAAGDVYYRDGSGNVVRVGIGGSGQQLTVASGLPAWKDTFYATATKTSSYTISASDTVVFANASGGAVTITLPTASSLPGYRFYVKRIDNSANTVTIARSGTDTIDGMTSFTLDLQYTAFIVVSNGALWYIL